jgi:argininosuccinate synthase
VRAHVLDVRSQFAADFLAPALRAGAFAVRTRDGRPVVAALAAPMLAQKLVEVAKIEEASLVAHAAADSLAAARIETAVRALSPHLTVHAPARDWVLTSAEVAAYARKHGLNAPAGVETRSGSVGPAEPAHVDITFERGVPTAVNGVSMPLVELVAMVGMIAGAHGIGQPEAVLQDAHGELQSRVTPREEAARLARFSRRVAREYLAVIERGDWFSPLREALDGYLHRIQDRATGVIRVELFGGAARIIGSGPAASHTPGRRLRVISTAGAGAAGAH